MRSVTPSPRSRQPTSSGLPVSTTTAPRTTGARSSPSPRSQEAAGTSACCGGRRHSLQRQRRSRRLPARPAPRLRGTGERPEGRLTSESVRRSWSIETTGHGPSSGRDLARELDRRDIRRPSAALAKLLKLFGIKPKQLRIDGFKERGYDIEWFEVESVAPFLAAPERDGRAGAQPGTAEASNQADAPVRTVCTDLWPAGLRD